MALSAFRRAADHRTLPVTHQAHLSSSLDHRLLPFFDLLSLPLPLPPPPPPPLPLPLPLPPPANVLPPRPLSLLPPPWIAQPFDPPPTLSTFSPSTPTIGTSSPPSRSILSLKKRKKESPDRNEINFSNRLSQSPRIRYNFAPTLSFIPTRVERILRCEENPIPICFNRFGTKGLKRGRVSRMSDFYK